MNLNSDMSVPLSRIVLAHELNTTGKILSDYRHGRKVWGMSYAISGKAEYRLNTGRKITVLPTDVVFFDKESEYLALTLEEYRHYTVNFELAEPIADGILDEGGVSIIRNDGGVYKSLFATLVQLWKEKRFGFQLRAASVLYELFAHFFKDLSLGGESDYLKRRLLPVKEMIDRRYFEPLCIAELADAAGMSVTHFRREFLRVFGISAIRYRDTVRLLHAKDALCSGAYTVAETGRACGFSDASYFARFFKKHTGVCAEDYKKLYG